MIQYLLTGDVLGFVITALVLVIALALHEFGHALAATLQGDDTAKNQGRLTINPIKHLDPVGSVFILLVGFGWGKPVPFNPYALRNRRFGSALVGAAGPLVNLLLAMVSAFFWVRTSSGLLNDFFATSLGLNVLLALFNLIPIPPLDGSRILSALLPPDKQRFIFWVDRWGFLLLLAVVWILPRFGPWIVLRGAVIEGFIRLAGG